MKKLKEIGLLLADTVTAIGGLTIAMVLPIGILNLFIKFANDSNVAQMSIIQQLTFLIVGLWFIDIVIRPVISRLININLDRLNSLFVYQKKEEVNLDATKSTATTDA